ncbi:MAG: SRPBCC family protein [Solirubrobacterales bacterium]
MRVARAKITIDRPIDEVYDYLLDIGTRPEFAPNVFLDFRLSRIESKGLGAGARYRLHRKLRDRYAGTTLTEAVPGERILEEGSTGRGGRVPLAIEYMLEEQPGGPTKVEWAIESHPLNLVDQIREFRFHAKIRRKMPSALRRLRGILEQTPNASRGERATVAGLDSNYVPNP